MELPMDGSAGNPERSERRLGSSKVTASACRASPGQAPRIKNSDRGEGCGAAEGSPGAVLPAGEGRGQGRGTRCARHRGARGEAALGDLLR